jgi:hypothetical protein
MPTAKQWSLAKGNWLRIRQLRTLAAALIVGVVCSSLLGLVLYLMRLR